MELTLIIYQDEILIANDGNNMMLPLLEQINPISSYFELILKNDSEIVARVIDNQRKQSILSKNQQFEFVNMRKILALLSPELLTRTIYYKSLLHYYEQKFCGYCGDSLQKQSHNIFLYCNKCSREIYPHIAPSIIVRITKNNQILMARNINFAPHVWGLIAGYVEIGENLETAVNREVKEEIGIQVKNIKYFGSEPWPFPGITMMIAFTAEYASGELKLQENEIAEAGFFSKENLPGFPSSKVSIAYKMIQDFINS